MAGAPPGARLDGELHREALFIPRYRPAVSGEWELRVAAFGHSPGYWSGPVAVEGLAALIRRGESWMSLTPLEIESQETGIRAARGHVLIFGLGMGWAAAACAARPAVDAVTVVERDPDVIGLHRELDIFSQLPPEARTKVRIVEGDAFAYRPDRPVDLMMPDIWLPIVSDGRVDEVRRMQANAGSASIYFWGQELEIARHSVAAGRRIDGTGIAATVTEFALPLAGTAGSDYPLKVEAAARQWMRGRWLPGSVALFD
jgi:hypothetical protein